MISETERLFQIASAVCVGASGAFLASMQYYGGKLLRHDFENESLRSIIFEQSARISALTLATQAATEPTTQMCGGCGAYLTQEEIDACPGEACSRFVETALPQLSFPWDPKTGTFGAGELK